MRYINLNVVEGISKSLSYSVCSIDISIYPNNLFVNLASEHFYTPVQLATKIMPLKLPVRNKTL